MSEPLLRIENLHVSAPERPILRGLSLAVPRGQVHALMGPNGSGKSTLANVLMGHPGYRVTAGRVLFKGEEITALSPDERARRGMFLACQYPVEVPGVSLLNFLRAALTAVRGQEVPVRQFRELLERELLALGMDLTFARRALGEGFSGGEKKRNEVLQMAVLRPELAILDETDSGLDIDGIRLVAQTVNALRTPRSSSMIITHYLRILTYLEPDVVHVLLDGRLVLSGGPELARQLERGGYDALRSEYTDSGEREGRGTPEERSP